MAASKIDRNFLNQQEVIKLSRWLAEQHAALNSIRPTMQKAADMASTALGFKVNDRNLKSVVEASEMTINFTGTHNSGTVGASLWNARLTKLRGAIVQLYEKMGEPVPEELNGGW